MIKINLLPKKVKKFSIFLNFYFILGLLLILIISGFAVLYFYQREEISLMTKRNIDLKQESSNLENILKEVRMLEKNKQNINSQINSLESLSKNRGYLALILDEIGNQLPADIWLIDFKNDNENIILTGNSISKESINKFIDNLKSTAYFSEIKINHVKDILIKNRSISEFELYGILKK